MVMSFSIVSNMRATGRLVWMVIVLSCYTNNSNNTAAVDAAVVVTTYQVTGNTELWKDTFGTPQAQPRVVMGGSRNSNSRNSDSSLVWTEGPVVIPKHVRQQQKQHNNKHLLFSDTIGNAIYSLTLTDDETPPSLQVELKPSGGQSQESSSSSFTRLEPGSNGLVLLQNPHVLNHDKKEDTSTIMPLVLACQHTSRAVTRVDLETGQQELLVTHYQGKRFNGPNDLVVLLETNNNTNTSMLLYFTDPPYAWLADGSAEDLPYLDERVLRDGPGVSGVYQVPLLWNKQDNVNNNNDNGILEVGEVKRVIDSMTRPNGLAVWEHPTRKGDNNHERKHNTLVVSDCCQGHHNPNCSQGTSRWNLFQPNKEGEEEETSLWKQVGVIEDHVPNSIAGCSDGFKILPKNTHTTHETLLIGSCAEGLCLVNLTTKRVEARLWTVQEDGCKVSNIAIDAADHRIFITGNCGIWELPLVSAVPSSFNSTKTLFTHSDEF
jgi:sugar lactone lactonase YvrE